MTIEEETRDRTALCLAILRELPEWFGIPSAVEQYGRDVASMPVLAARHGDDAVGFLALREHNAVTCEVHVMGVRRAWHRAGVGRALVEAAAARARASGHQLLSVKTLAESRACAEYERTRRFYLALGFLPVEEFPTLWGPENPCLLMVRPLRLRDAGSG